VSELRLLWVGRRPRPAWEALAQEYLARLGRLTSLTEARLKPAVGRGGDPARALAIEARSIRDQLAAGDRLVVLDEEGTQRSSTELARWLGDWHRRGRLVFVIGSDLGIDPDLKREAWERMSLSRLTMPHEMARVVLLEQLFRAFDILCVGGYHRGSPEEG
jgi:23S rRNA (pseudouridine1915-N3)-methyltransferase